MGSFNVSCGVSGLSISEGDPVAFFPLKRRDGAEHVRTDCANIVTNYGPFALYNCKTLPIFGKYADYGRIDVKEDQNTKIIEKHFDASGDPVTEGGAFIHQIVGAWTEFESGYPGMFIHGEVYRGLSTAMEGDAYLKNRSTLEGIFPVPPKMLERLGFVQTAFDIEGRYNLRYAHPDSDAFAIVSDGAFCHIEVNGKEVGLIHSIRDLAKKVSKFGVILNTKA